MTAEHAKTREAFVQGNDKTCEAIVQGNGLVVEQINGLREQLKELQNSTTKMERATAESNAFFNNLRNGELPPFRLDGTCVSQIGSEDSSLIDQSVSFDEKPTEKTSAKVNARYSSVSSETTLGSARTSRISRRPGSSVKSSVFAQSARRPPPPAPRRPEAYERHVENIERGRENAQHNKLCKGESRTSFLLSTLSRRVLIPRSCSARPHRAACVTRRPAPAGEGNVFATPRLRRSRRNRGGEAPPPREIGPFELETEPRDVVRCGF